MIRVEHVSAGELRQGDLRFEGGYYCSDGAQARRFLARSGIPTATLKELCVPGGIFIPHRFKRPYVRDSGSGIPYVTGSSVGLTDPRQGCAYLSRNPRLIPHKAQLMLEAGLILVTSSGETGNVVYTGALFEAMIGSPDLLRLVANTDVVRPGYLYAFLASPLGKGLLTQGTYGGVVPHIEASHVLDVPVPRLGDEREQTIHELVEGAVRKRVEANARLQKAHARVYEVTGLPCHGRLPVGRNLEGARTYIIDQYSIKSRFEARYHDSLVRELEDKIRNNRHSGWVSLGDCAEVFLPDRGKWINVSVGGIPLVGSGDMFLARPIASRHVSAQLSPRVMQLIVRRGDILVARSGQIYSILGDAVIVGRSLAGKAVTEDAIRISARPETIHPGYLYAFLTLPDYGYGQLVRTAYGTSIPHLPVHELPAILVPLPDKPLRDAIGDDVLQAIELRDEANDLEDEAQRILSAALGFASQEAHR